MSHNVTLRHTPGAPWRSCTRHKRELLRVVVAHLVVVALVDLLAAIAAVVVMVTVPLVVASTTNPGNHPDPTVVLHHAHNANCASRSGTLQSVGIDMKKILPLSRAMPLLLLPLTSTTTGTPTLGPRIT
jgi:hypothetical protein